jgi:translation initiation factor IF-3
VPVPRRFDRRLPERDLTRINDRIRVPEVRLIGEDGNQIGVIKTPDALKYAEERDLDLVEVAPDARPPVCRVLDYSKYKYEQAQKQKAARKHQQQITIREIKFRPKIAQNDYDTKKNHVERFLKGKDKVKVTIMFRGREVTHPERGVALLDKLASELGEIAIVEQSPLQDGRNMTMMLAPSKAILAEEGHAHADEPGDKKPRRQQRDHEHDEELHEDAVDDAPESEAAVEDAPEAATEDKAPEPVAVEAEAPAAAINGAAPQAEALVPVPNGKAAKPATNGSAAKPAAKRTSAPKPAPTATSEQKPVAPEPETAK